MTHRVRHFFLGGFLMIFGLGVASFLISILFVVSQFQGNAVFPVDCAVVFGSAVHREGEAGPGIERRVGEAVDLWEKGSVKRLIFTGGLGEGNRLSEARVMRNEALSLGVEPEIITMEEGARSTWQSVKFVQAFTRDCASIVAISDRYHLARIRFLAWQQGLDVVVHPARDIPPPLFEVKAILREGVGNVVYLFAWFS